jgi:CDP-paratose 2-epimerase
MRSVLVTGAGGLIGSEAARFFLSAGDVVYGIENNTRRALFGDHGDISCVITELSKHPNFTNYHKDIRDREGIVSFMKRMSPDIIVHCAAQPSHDKAAKVPFLDFDINAGGTFNLLEAARRHCDPAMVFIHMSTNKVYGDKPNTLKLIENEKRFDFAEPEYEAGIAEDLSIDNSTHSLFGASKVAADIIAQEYGRYFDMNIGIFRGGCLTGPQHAGVELHGFLSYIVKCAIHNKPYTIFGYGGKQVRDQIHSKDVISAFAEFIRNPQKGEAYNIGGQRMNSASILETIDSIYTISGAKLNYTQSSCARVGDHICYYSDMAKFKTHFPNWRLTYSLEDIIREIIEREKR